MNIRHASNGSAQNWSPSTGLGGRLRLDSPVAFNGMRKLVRGEGLWNLISARSAPIIAAIDVKRSIALWNGLTGSKISTITPCKPEDSCHKPKMALSDDGQLLVTLHDKWARPEGQWKYELQGYGVRLWDVETGAELAAFELTHTPGREPELAVSPDLRRVAVHVGDHVQIWRVNEMPGPAWQGGEAPAQQQTPWSARLERVLILPPTLVSFTPAHSVAFSADGRKLVASSGSLLMWEVGVWREIWRVPSFLLDFFLTADGRRIITRSSFYEVPELDKSGNSANHSHLPRPRSRS
jgi:WD40 repeat protein